MFSSRRRQLFLCFAKRFVKTMAIEFVYILLVISLGSVKCAVSRGTFIGECIWSGGPSESVTFLCHDQQIIPDRFFNYEHKKKPCSNNRDGYIKDSIGVMSFQNCALQKIPVDIIEYYRYVWKLNISDISLKSLGQKDFNGKYEQRLRTLVASHNLLIEIEPGLFNGAQHIRDVDFSFNKIKRIASAAFTNATEMLSLDLSNNNLAKLDDRTFQSLHNLETLILRNNQIDELNVLTFAGLSTLAKLDLSYNMLTHLNAEAFEDLVLNCLNVSHNGITEFDANLFSHFNQMQILDISYNNISSLNDTFYSMSATLRELYMSNNHIKSINGLAASTFMLTVLDVSKNEISDLCEHIFDNFTNLNNINLSLNPIKKLGRFIFAKHANLLHLNLSQISLTNIEPKTFLKPQKLQSIDLSKNKLKKVDFKMFLPRFKDLHRFYLEGNDEISDLAGFRRQLFPNLHTLGIQNNNFNCSYLHTFFDKDVWHELTIEVDRIYTFEVEGDNVGGIRCKVVEEPDEVTDSDQIDDQVVTITPPPLMTNKYAKMILKPTEEGTDSATLIVLSCIVIVAIVAFAFVMYKTKIMNYFGINQLAYSQNYSRSTLSVGEEPMVFTEVNEKNIEGN
ncbi:chaoptin-like [Sitodiplosis mosellana]|uniref:chaoptin-like n=1 Tax=Sitodiplosis mosellana TaxID=263140 RepID=UPI00244381BC|nr:chaoptin-like [Sitodiplosis mosellana]